RDAARKSDDAGLSGRSSARTSIPTPRHNHVSLRIVVRDGVRAPDTELFFRRVIFGALRRRWCFAWAALGSAALFALVHAYSPVGTLTVLWAGLVAAWTLERTATLWPAVLIHAVNNALAVAFSLT